MAAPAIPEARSRRKLRKDVALIGPERQWLYPSHRGERQIAVKMRKQITAARSLPSQRFAERVRVDRDQQQILDAGEILGRGRADLRGGGEMDEAVAHIDRRTAEHTLTLGLTPKCVLADLVNGRHGAAPTSIAFVSSNL